MLNPLPAFSVVDSTLAPDALAWLVRDRYDNYGSNQNINCTFIKRGTNDTYLLSTHEPHAVLRVYPHGWRTREQIEEELLALDHLSKARVWVSHAIPSRDGGRIQIVAAPEGERQMVLFSYARGDFGAFDNSHLFELGKSLAEIHERSNDLPPFTFRPRLDVRGLVVDAISRANAPPSPKREEGLAVCEEQIRFLHSIAQTLNQKLNDVSGTSPHYGFCHGDFAGFNTHVIGGNQTHFDFDFCGFGPRAYDLAVMLWSRHKIAGRTLAPKQFTRFVEGYESVRKLTDAEHRAIPYFVLCREIFIMGLNVQNLNRFPRRPSEDPVAPCADFVKRWIDDHNLDC